MNRYVISRAVASVLLSIPFALLVRAFRSDRFALVERMQPRDIVEVFRREASESLGSYYAHVLLIVATVVLAVELLAFLIRRFWPRTSNEI